MDSFTKDHLKYQIDWVLKELAFMIEIGPRHGTNLDNLDSEADILAVALINPILQNAITSLKLQKDNIEPSGTRNARKENLKRVIHNFEEDRKFNKEGKERFHGDDGVISGNRSVFDITP